MLCTVFGIKCDTLSEINMRIVFACFFSASISSRITGSLGTASTFSSAPHSHTLGSCT